MGVFSGDRICARMTGEEGGKVSIEIVKVDEFNYLESNIHSNIQCTRKVMKSVQAGWR